MFERPQGGDRALLVNLDLGEPDQAARIEELKELAVSCGLQRRGPGAGPPRPPDPATFAGTGKVRELAAAVADAAGIARGVQPSTFACAGAQPGEGNSPVASSIASA